LGVPLTEAGCLMVNGVPVTPGYRPGGGDVARIGAVTRPQPVPVARFVLDVHLGALARRLRLTGVDTAYATGLDDDVLIEQANTQRRVLLTQDRGLLRRRALWLGAYVHGARPDDQLADVLGRFAPPLAPWTRCPACNSLLRPVPKAEVEPVLPPGPHLPGVLPLPGLRARVLARRARPTARSPDRICRARGQRSNRRSQHINANSGRCERLARHRAGDAHDGRNAANVMSRPNDRAPSRPAP
jgi:uncharacterized protein with PIN domain